MDNQTNIENNQVDGKIQVPSFINENYYHEKYNEHVQTIHKLKIYNKALKFIAFGATLTLLAINPNVQKTVHDVVTSYNNYKDEMYDDQIEAQKKEVEEITGRKVEDIVDAGKSIR